MPSAGGRSASALHELALYLRASLDELARLADRADHLAAALDAGSQLGPAIADEERPLVITHLVDITDRLNELGGAIRRAEAQQLVEEGYSQERIAAEFGVTRQRVGALLRPASGSGPGPKRPARG